MNTENNYQATDLGNISPNPRGDYDASASYEYLDLVNMDGGSYICLAELGTTVTGISPEPGKTTETWQCIALPGDLTPEYIAMHDDVVNKAESVAEDTKNVTEMHENVTGMESNVQELQKQAAQSTEEAEASKDSAAGYARAADASRQAAEEAEANVNAQVTGFDSHVAEKTAEAEGAIVKARQAAVEVVHTATNTATNAAERAGSAASTAEEAKTAAAGSKTNAAASASAAKTSETNAKTSEEAAKEAMQAAQDAAAGVVADREQIAALKKTKSSAIVQIASGTAIVAQDSSDDPVRGLRVFGRTIQDGTPTPDAPVPLVSVGDAGSVEVGVYGKNLLENIAITTTKNGITFTVNDNRSVTVDGTATATAVLTINQIIKMSIKGGKYIFSGCPIGGSNNTYRMHYYDGVESNNYASDTGSGTEVNVVNGNSANFAIVIKEGVTVSNLVFRPMLRLASAADDSYEPYRRQSLTALTPNGLPGIKVSDASLATYTDADGQMWCSDEVDLERGVYVQRIYNVTYDGSDDETIIQDTCDLGYRYSQDLPYAVMKSDLTTGQKSMNSNFLLGEEGKTWIEGNIYTINVVDNISKLFVSLNGNESLEEFKMYLAEKPMTVLAILATPIETPLTESELSAYQSLHSNYLVTTVLNDAGAHMEFSYNADPKNYIAAEHAKMEAAFDAKLSEIIALLPAETQAAMIENETTNLLNESEE